MATTQSTSCPQSTWHSCFTQIQPTSHSCFPPLKTSTWIFATISLAVDLVEAAADYQVARHSGRLATTEWPHKTALIAMGSGRPAGRRQVPEEDTAAHTDRTPTHRTSELPRHTSRRPRRAFDKCPYDSQRWRAGLSRPNISLATCRSDDPVLQSSADDPRIPAAPCLLTIFPRAARVPMYTCD